LLLPLSSLTFGQHFDEWFAVRLNRLKRCTDVIVLLVGRGSGGCTRESSCVDSLGTALVGRVRRVEAEIARTTGQHIVRHWSSPSSQTV
jgi:hypothetical protein